ncbi:MAG: PEGA domain-containing protein [Lentisphaerae bacterium]|nr:PEGA domain-containing protein [Lentisphaerota bacterium]MCP4100575.1 PEGA domain-containing protein [Lentisphaerota bacterium]
MKHSLSLLTLSALLLLCGCESFNYTKHQSVPVSSIPAGANIFVDGKEAGVTPANLNLPCTQSHIVSLFKDGYKQCDVVIKRVYCPENAVIDATNNGIRSGDFFGSANQGVANGLASYVMAESRGETYKLPRPQFPYL